MRSHTFTLLTAAALATGLVTAQLQRIVVQGSCAPRIFSEINAAIAAAQPNDKVYLSGGTHSSEANTPIVIDKPLHFIGAGIHPDSTGATGITTLANHPHWSSSGGIHITKPASGSTFTGIVFWPMSAGNGVDLRLGTNASDDDPTGLVFERCRFVTNMVLSSGSQGGSASTFNECVFDNVIVWGWGLGNAAVFNRCIFYSNGNHAIHQVSPLTADHCVFLNSRICRDSPGAIIRNSVCTFGATSHFYQSSGSTITNCIFTSGDPLADNNAGGFVFQNNQVGVPTNTVFLNETDGVFQFSDDLRLVPGSPGIGWADDGTDAGLYGSSSPYKPGAVPYNPHYRSAEIAPATNPDGDLPVNIRTAAQTH